MIMCSLVHGFCSKGGVCSKCEYYQQYLKEKQRKEKEEAKRNGRFGNDSR